MVSMYGEYYKYGKEYHSWLYSLSPGPFKYIYIYKVMDKFEIAAGGGNVGFFWAATVEYKYIHLST